MDMDNRIVGITSSPETGELDKAMVQAMQSFQAVRQSATNRFAKYSYETFTDIANATFPHMLKAGVRPVFYTGFVNDREVLVAKLKHGESGQWEACTVYLLYPHDRKTGELQHDNQGAETADTYAKKRALRMLTSCWVAGEGEAAVDDEADKAASEEISNEAVKEVREKKAAPLMERIRSSMQMLKGSPEALAAKFQKAEQCCMKGEITEEELQSLREEFDNADAEAA